MRSIRSNHSLCRLAGCAVGVAGLLCGNLATSWLGAADLAPGQAEATAAAAVQAAAAAAQQEKEDQEAIQAYLAKAHPKVTTATPGRMDTPAIRTAYPGYRFYVIKMRFPMGIPTPPDWHETHIDLTVSIDTNGKLETRGDANAMNIGLMKITTDEEAKTAAAAIMSLLIAGSGIQKVEAAQVKVEANEQFRMCAAQVRALTYKIIFNQAGKCTQATLQDNSPPRP